MEFFIKLLLIWISVLENGRFFIVFFLIRMLEELLSLVHTNFDQPIKKVTTVSWQLLQVVGKIETKTPSSALAAVIKSKISYGTVVWWLEIETMSNPIEYRIWKD